MSSAGCLASLLDEVITLGANPPADFSWLDECFGTNPVLFTDESNAPPSDNVTFFWDFGDGVTDTAQNPNHVYTSTSSFDVSLTLSSAFNCSSTIIKTITIRPYITTYPYFQDFENGHGGWVSGSLVASVNSWERGVPNAPIIASAFSGDTCWVTNLDTVYFDQEDSWVLSPCFNFDSLEKPMLIFQAMVNTGTADGVIVQYTIDDITWNRLGSINDGINWYNASQLPSSPGDQPPGSGNQGWSGPGDSSWFEVRNSLDTLVGQSYVRLRIAFSSVSQNGEGFAFDDIWIGERTRGVLVEHFTNSDDFNSFNSNPGLNDIINANPLDVMDIQYHTNFPGADPMNDDNPADPSARSLYYGISDLPYTIQDGNDFKNSTFLYTQATLDLRKLRDPVFSIDLSTDMVNNTDLTVSATIRALDTLQNSNISVHFAVLEDLITNLTGTFGDTVFESVLKNMLPNAAGTQFIQSWNPGDSAVVSEFWKMDNVYDPSQVTVVAFVQDNDTKEVYQAVRQINSSFTTAIPSIKHEGFDFAVYPNPTDERLNIAFSGRLREGSLIRVYDQLGSLVEVYDIPKGIYGMGISTSTYANGIYLIAWSNIDGTLATKKVIVQH